MKNFSRKPLLFPHFLYLLPLFFVFHGYAQNPAPVTFSNFVYLVGEYLLASGGLFLLGWLLYRQWQKAALLAFGLLFLHFFFGAFHDVLKNLSPTFFLAKYSVLLPVLFVSVLLFIFYLKKTNSRLLRLFTYLNLLFILLLVIDIPVLLLHKDKKELQVSLHPCADCSQPDVYLIIADEYADSTSLSEIFYFNNGPFLKELRKRGFYIANSVSNYNFTPFAMASLLSMNYITGLEGRNSSYPDQLKTAFLINQNTVWDLFVKSGYEIRNNSIYKIENIPSIAQHPYFRIGTDFIASHTLLKRLKRDLGYHLVTTLKIESVINDYVYYLDRINKRLLNRHSADVRHQQEKSRFVYTHIHTPHYPYYYKSDGSPNPEMAKRDNIIDKQSYLEYLQYGNKIYLSMIDEIMRQSTRPPVIIFMGDHGFRNFANASPKEKQSSFMNLNAVYLPNGDYSHFYNGISGVNQFRVILNSAFGQKLPMLKDSSSFLLE